MLPSGTIEGFRTRWATRFIDPVTITSIGDRGTFNPSTLQYDSPVEQAKFSGYGLLRPMSGQASRDLFGEVRRSVVGVHAYLPFDTTVGPAGIEVGDKVVRTFDGNLEGALDLIGWNLYVVSWQFDAYETRLRLDLEVDLGGRDNDSS